MLKRAKQQKPAKPYEDFPLTAHPSGVWCKKIKGKLHYFGPWDDWEAALKRFRAERDDLYAGRMPANPDAPTVATLLDHFLYDKQLRVQSGELTARSYAEYEKTCDRIAESITKWRVLSNLAVADFQRLRADLAKGANGPVGLVRLRNELSRARSVFLYGNESGLAEKPIPYRLPLKSPSQRSLRRTRLERGPLMFSAKDINRMVKAADLPLKAMILLGINCGFGNSDCAKLTFEALDLKNGWHNFARPKTHNLRRAKLWPETVTAIKAAIKIRPPHAAGDERLVFLTRFGRPWSRESGDNAISSEFADLLQKLKIHRKGNTFYSLRRTFETIGGAGGEQVAVDHIMGHARDDMPSIYRQKVFDEKLTEVSNFVHQWLKGKIKLT